MNTNLINFLQETYKRFIAPVPKYFRVWRMVFAIVTALTGLPEFLVWLGVKMPLALEPHANKIVAIAAVIAGVMAQMTVQNKPIAVSDGEVLKVTNPDILPFTAKHEAKKLAKDENNI